MVRLSPETISSTVNFSAASIFRKAFLHFSEAMFENVGDKQINQISYGQNQFREYFKIEILVNNY